MKREKPAYRLLSLLLALVMILGMLPTPHASATKETVSFQEIDADEIEVGKEILIVSEASGAKIYALANNDDKYIKVTKADEFITVSKDIVDTALWTVGAATGSQSNGGTQAFTFSNNGTYLGRLNSNNTIELSSNGSADGIGYRTKFFGHAVSEGTIGNYSPEDIYYGLSYGPKNGSNQFYYGSDNTMFKIKFYAKEVPTATLTGIAVTTQPTKTTYTAGENFDPAGMVITATYSDNTTKPVTGYTVTDGNNLTADKTAVTVSYTEGDETRITTVPITVKEHSYATTLSYDETHHWYAATCGHDVVKDKEEHHGGTATCTAKAVCTDCGQSYGNLAAHSYDTTKWEKDEDGHWHECACGAKQENSFAQHSYTDDRDSDCNTCGYNRTVHICEDNLTSKPGQAATCTVDGWKGYYQCSCNRLYEDEQATTEITDLAAWKVGTGKIAAGHDYGDLITKVDATHTATELKAGKEAHYQCSVCQKFFDKDKQEVSEDALVIPAPTHSYGATTYEGDGINNYVATHACSCGKSETVTATIENAVTEPATCIKVGTRTYTASFSVDWAVGKVTPVDIPMTDHSFGTATTSGDGKTSYTATRVCRTANCGETETATATITFKAIEPATCTSTGTGIYTADFAEVWAPDKSTEIIIPMTAHTSSKVTGQAATCTVDGWKDYYECSVCHAPFVDEALANPIADLAAWKVGAGKIAAGHTYGDLIAKVEPIHTATELKAGKEAHYKCSVCSKFFDKDKKEVTEDSLTIAAPTHSYDTTVWKNDTTQHWHACSCGAKTDAANHTSSGAATESTPETCTVCGYVITAALDHVHTRNLTAVAAKDPTCTENGNIQYYSCSCGKLFADEAATQEVTNVILPAKGHTEIIQNAVEATCTEDGLTEGSYCNVCGTVFTAQQTVAALGHTPVAENETAATCEKDGNTAGIYCEVCNEYLTLPEVIPALGHDWDDGEVTREPTETIPGIRTYTCQRADCGATMTEEIPYVPAEIYRICGEGRVETAIATANALKEALGIEKFNAIIIANGENFADALAGSYLATVKKAPILLHRNSGAGDDLNEYYIDKNLADGGTVYILGGEAAVPMSIEDELKATGYKVVRLAGADRFETGLAILKEAGISDEDEILIATGYNFADCLSASATGKPILTVNSNTNKLTDAQVEFLKAHSKNQYVIIGGTGAISQALEDAIAAIVEKDIVRVYGENREATSVKVAQRYFEEPAFVLIAYSRNFPDGLCAGPLAYALGAPLLLTSAGQETVAAEYINSNSITKGYIMGGSAVISDASARACFGMTSAVTIPSK